MSSKEHQAYRTFVNRLWGREFMPTPMFPTDPTPGPTIRMADVLEFAEAASGKAAPGMLTATDRLGRNLERTVSESTARAAVLRQEIAAREAELADVLRAEDAARAALGALAESGHEPYAEAPVEWPFGKLDGVSPITDEDLSAACGRALEAEKIGDVK